MIESKSPIRNIETLENKDKIIRKTESYNEDNYKQSNDFKLKHTTLKEQVKQILRQDIQSRSDYTWLSIMIWIKQDAIKFIIPLEDYKKMYKPESISRVARELFEEARNGNKELNFLLKDTENLEKRENLQELNRGYFQDKNNIKLAEVIK